MENQDNDSKPQKGDTKRYHDVILIPMVNRIRKKWFDTMKQITCISVDQNNGPYRGHASSS